MNNFSDEYKKALETEALQFIFLADKNDANLLIGKYRKKNMGEYVRLSCIAMVFGYKRILLKIMANLERDMNDYLKSFNIVDGNFALLESWVEGFISRISDRGAQNLAREYWEERKENFDIENFSHEQLI